MRRDATFFALFSRVILTATILLAPRSARAADAEVESSTVGQGYQVLGAQGVPVLTRNRLVETLGVGVYDLAGTANKGPQLFFRARLRMDADFGEAREEYDYARGGDARFVPGLPSSTPVDLMYGYVEGRGFARGLLGFKLGRQYVVDPLGFYAFDGALARITTPVFFALEAYGGLEQRAGIPFSTGRWELGGVQRGDRGALGDPTLRPSFQQAHVAPMYAVALESAGPTWIHGRLTYRKVMNTGESFVGGPAGAFVAGVGRTLGESTWSGTRTSSERVGYGMDVDLGDLASARGSLGYDLYGGNLSSAELGVDGFVSKAITVGADYTYFRPIFDADSIFNFFALEPMDDVSARVEVEPSKRVSVEADAMVRRYRADAADDPTRLASSYAPGGGLRARYLWPTARITTRVQTLSGDEGERYGADVALQKSFGRAWLFDARLSLWHFGDRLRADAEGRSRTTTSFGYVVGGGYRISTNANAYAQVEQDFNRLIGARLRVLAVLSVRFGG